MNSPQHLRAVLATAGTQDSDHGFVSNAIENVFPECVSHALIRRGHTLLLRLDGLPVPSDEELTAFGEAVGAESISSIESEEFWRHA